MEYRPPLSRASDIPLNQVGLDQVQALAEKFAGEVFDAIFSSDLSRASQTAAIIANQLHLPVNLDKRLREICQGIWEGMSADEVQAQYGTNFQQSVKDPHSIRAPGGETIAEVAERMALAANEIATKYPGGKVLVVSHGLAVATLYCQANHVPLTDAYNLVPENATPLIVNWGIEAPVS